MSGTVDTPYNGPPPLAGYVEDPPGSRQYVFTGASDAGTPGAITQGGGGSVGAGGGVAWPPAPAVVTPIADFSYQVYAGGIVGFVNLSQGLISNYLWSFGDGSFGSASNILHQYVGSGTFPVILRVANSAGQSSKTLNVTIPASPIVEVVDFTYVTGAMGVQFTDASTKAGTRNWSFGDGTTSTAINPYKLYDTPGIYTVTLTIGGVSQPYVISVDYGIVLNWTDNSSDETGFKIEHSLDGAAWALIDTVAAGVETLTVTKNAHGVDPAVTNFFRVYAYNSLDSDYSNEVETLCEG